jgi:hypothetical protein
VVSAGQTERPSSAPAISRWALPAYDLALGVLAGSEPVAGLELADRPAGSDPAGLRRGLPYLLGEGVGLVGVDVDPAGADRELDLAVEVLVAQALIGPGA